MKTIFSAAALMVSALLMITGPRPARADEGDVAFHFKNTLDDTVGVWIASEKSTKANPWAHLDVAAGETGTITLRAPDRFVVAVDVGGQRSRSKPIALKTFLTKHPDYVLNANLVQFVGVSKEGGSGLGGELRLDFSAPPKAADPSTPSNDAKPAEPPERLDFGFETKPIENNGGNQ
ncbi:MAG TPA: hypothetical protein VGY55_22640 [Pirellulales bacterium]|jgi:hypothetical protein|nr:hypothetical protein [Pirellulales bacterium]